jgi:hypothetical protein
VIKQHFDAINTSDVNVLFFCGSGPMVCIILMEIRIRLQEGKMIRLRLLLRLIFLAVCSVKKLTFRCGCGK